jgi:hypothetical protein
VPRHDRLVQVGRDLLGQQLGVAGGGGGAPARDVDANRAMPSRLQDAGQGAEACGGLRAAVHQHDVGHSPEATRITMSPVRSRCVRRSKPTATSLR